jgi:hypothetical protein
MDWSIEVRQDGDILVATVTGELDLKAYLSARDQIRKHLDATHSRSVLFDIRATVLHLSTLDVFDAASSNPGVIPGGTRYAIVFSPQGVPASNISFGETVASNRGAMLRAFSDISQARQWLAQDPQKVGGESSKARHPKGGTSQ